MRVLLVTNPGCGGAGNHDLRSIVEHLDRLGPVTHVEPSRGRFDVEVSRAAEGADLVVVAGGDGTLNCTVNALRARLEVVTLALLPMGTGNDLARSLELPLDPLRVAAQLGDGFDKAVDLGRARGAGIERLFINACMGGFPVRVDEAIDEDLKRRLGPAAFWYGGAKALGELARSRVRLNGIEVDDCLAVGVGNGRTCGGGLEVWPRAAIDDGVLEGCALPASGIADALKLGAKVKAGTHEDVAEVRSIRGRAIEIDADPPIEVNVDGELVGLKTPANFEVVAKLRMRVVPTA